MKVNHEKSIKVNNQLKVNNVDKQQNDITDLKEHCNKDDKDKVQKISGAGTPMNKNKSVCVTCSKNYRKKSGLKNHIMEGPMIQCKPLFPLGAY